MSRVTVVVPLIPSHDRFLPELFACLVTDRDVLDKIVISRSHFGWKRKSLFVDETRRVAEEFELIDKLEFSLSRWRNAAGRNRNLGWKKVQSKWTAFVDADDLYLPNRLSSLLTFAESNSDTVNLVLHGYEYQPNENWDCDFSRNLPVSGEITSISSSIIFDATFPNGIRRTRKERDQQGGTNLTIPIPGSDSCHEVPHGHSFVRTEVRKSVRFKNRRLRCRCEDGLFCRDVLWKLGGVHYLPVRWSIYRINYSSARPMRVFASARDRLRPKR